MACLVAPTLLHETSEVLIPVERNAQKGDLQKNAKYLRVIPTVPLNLMFFLAFYLTLFLTFFLAFFLAFYLTSTMTYFFAFYCVFFPDIFSGILSGIYSDILSGILSGIYSDILSRIFSGIRVQACPTESGARDMVFGSRHAPQHLELVIWCPALAPQCRKKTGVMAASEGGREEGRKEELHLN